MNHCIPKSCVFAGCLLLALATLTFLTPMLADEQEDTKDPEDIVVARLMHQKEKSSKCFNHAFLSEVDRRSTVKVHRQLKETNIDSDHMYQYPMLIMNGEKSFQLNDEQKARLKAYLERGGFLLASADCSDPKWNASFQALMKELFPKESLKTLENDHPIFNTLFKIERVITVKPTPNAIQGLTLNNRLAVVYSPIGVNDAANMGADCCCCGANEIRNARQVNANILVYAASH